ncbi:hypothetical protein D3C85_952300 [compost metagenome]
MEDLELLEMAAKAAGIQHVDYDGLDYDGSAGLVIVGEHGQHLHGWNPLTDDGDAFRLAVQLAMFNGAQMFHFRSLERFENPQAAELEHTRRAIVRTAAEIGRKMP